MSRNIRHFPGESRDSWMSPGEDQFACRVPWKSPGETQGCPKGGRATGKTLVFPLGESNRRTRPVGDGKPGFPQGFPLGNSRGVSGICRFPPGKSLGFPKGFSWKTPGGIQGVPRETQLPTSPWETPGVSQGETGWVRNTWISPGENLVKS